MMALYAEIRKVNEDNQFVRYAYVDAGGAEQTVLLNKTAETISLESGVENMLYRAVARKIASTWLSGSVPERMIVQS
ncbi:hypothetical protein [Nocardia brasiliensis]|uniref:Uncharacterized protein n=1 Tax=Nocardia brasiliensis (strain ATCC 700358 / HUJEG-1) TaxID=1133849 RepID=K0EKI0_NOCB7|nr:hypothetical protein [Nocardia brasiliensis]AFT99877.1 hypothetical protein O3I_009585 [Nocardia brasiliensis ATCC 700358]OCF87391.1 hypothetical protein AW168_25805 [Nocardia brasiliensis]